MDRLTNEQLRLITLLLEELEKYEVTKFHYSDLHETGKIDFAIDALKLLLKHAQDNKFQDDANDYRYLYEHAHINNLLSFIKNNPLLIKRYLDNYPGYLADLAKDELFNKKLSEMTGKEFEKYLKYLGIIK